MYRYISKVIRNIKVKIAVSELERNLDALRDGLGSCNDIITQYTNLKTTINQDKDTSELSTDLEKNLDTLRNVLGSSNDIVIRKFKFGCDKQSNGALVYVDGLVNTETIDYNIMKPLMYDVCLISEKAYSDTSNIDIIQETLLSVSSVQKITSLGNLLEGLLSGIAILFVDGSKEALGIIVKKWEIRNIEQPETENVVRGPREGFTETLRINTTLLRRKIRNPDLHFETFIIGEETRTEVCIAYIKGIVNPKLILEVKKRLNGIQTDTVLESGYIEAFIEDAPYSIFATIGNSEKPDTVAAKILEGRVAIFVDGTPFVLTVPMLFIENFQSSEDYYSRPFFSSLVRTLRFFSFALSVLAPALYVALSTFHQELIPTTLLLTMAAAHEGVPFPSVMEAGMMIIMFEILREGGIRLPRPVGSTISIVGALVIGESAVTAGLIGAPMVIVLAITAVSSFVVPAQIDAGSIIRFILLILAGFTGGYGIAIGLLGFLIHLASLRSFGTPYLSPLAPLSTGDLKDSIVRVPLWAMLTRPRTIAWYNPQRQNFRLKSNPTHEYAPKRND
jgi:spore germination protein KA